MKSKLSQFIVTECASLCHNTYEMGESNEQWYSALTYFRGLIRNTDYMLLLCCRLYQ